MKSYRFGLSSFTRKKFSRWLSVVLGALLFLPAVTLAAPRRTVSVTPGNPIKAAAVESILIEVTTTNDGDNLDPTVGCDTEPGIPGDQCSLRAAIQRANLQPGNAEIRFNIPATEFNCNSGLCIINLTRALPSLTANMRIVGPGAEKLWLRRSTGGDYRIFMVTTATDVTLSGMTINSGRPAGVSSGGALVNGGYGIVNVTDCVLSNNSAGASGGYGGAISNEGPVMRVTNSKFRLNIATIGGSKGGGIYQSTGALTVTDSTLSNNEGYGIEIGEFSNISTTIVSSTISGNTFGGISTEFATVPTGKVLNITNSTITGNTGGPGVGIFRGMLNVTNSTISNNEGGGIKKNIPDNNGTWTVKSSIVAGNGSGFGDVFGVFTSQGYNLIGNADLATGFANGVNNDQVGTAGSPLDPKFDPAGLQDRGGPTQTIALLADSPAVDKGTATGLNGLLATDQRGAARAFDDPAVPNSSGGDGTDVGAFELQPGGPTPTPTPTPSPSPSPTPSPSPSPSPSPQLPSLTVTTSPMVRTTCGDIVVAVTVHNTGSATANNVKLTLGTLSSPATSGTPLPQSLGNLAPGRSGTVIVTFSGGNNPAGAKRTLRFDGTYTSGTFTDKWNVKLP